VSFKNIFYCLGDVIKSCKSDGAAAVWIHKKKKKRKKKELQCYVVIFSGKSISSSSGERELVGQEKHRDQTEIVFIYKKNTVLCVVPPIQERPQDDRSNCSARGEFL